MSGQKTVTKSQVTPPEMFASQMRQMVMSKEFSDVRFLVGQERTTIFGHRVIIGARCQKLKTLFRESASSPDVPIILNEISPKVFELVLEFAYTNQVSFAREEAIELLSAAMRLQMLDLQKMCCDLMIASLTSDFAAEVFHAAVYYEISYLETKCLKYIEDNAQDFFADKSYLGLGEEPFMKILQSSGLNIGEMDVLNAVMEWGKQKASELVNTPIDVIVRNVIKMVRICIFDVDELAAIEKMSREHGCFIPPEMFHFAWKFHAVFGSADAATNFKQGDSSATSADPAAELVKDCLWGTLRRGSCGGYGDSTSGVTEKFHHAVLNPWNKPTLGHLNR